MDRQKCLNILLNWLEQCNSISKISFNIEAEINTRLNGVKGYRPFSLNKLRNENPDLYKILNLKENKK